MWETLAAVASAIIAAFALYREWKKTREDSLRREEVLSWANSGIEQIKTLHLLIILSRTHRLDGGDIDQRMSEVIFGTSITIEKGRLFFKNEVINDHGADKADAYKGYRPLILDQLIVAHQIACAWPQAKDDERLRMEVVADDCAKAFVSLAQKEVGRGQTASVDTRKGGDGAHLWYRLQQVSDQQLARLRR